MLQAVPVTQDRQEMRGLVRRGFAKLSLGEVRVMAALVVLLETQEVQAGQEIALHPVAVPVDALAGVQEGVMAAPFTLNFIVPLPVAAVEGLVYVIQDLRPVAFLQVQEVTQEVVLAVLVFIANRITRVVHALRPPSVLKDLPQMFRVRGVEVEVVHQVPSATAGEVVAEGMPVMLATQATQVQMLIQHHLIAYL